MPAIERERMNRERVAEAIRLREDGRTRQDEATLEQARTLLLELGAAYPEDAEITYQTAIAHDNLGLEREAIDFYVRALAQGLSGADRERALLGPGSTYRGLGEYHVAVETLRAGVSEFPRNRALQVFLAMALYNIQRHTEAMELLLTNLIETTTDEKLIYYKRPLTYYAAHLDEVE